MGEADSIVTRIPMERQTAAHLVIHSVEQPGYHREDCWAQCLHVLRQESDISLEEPNPSSVAVNYRLGTTQQQKAALWPAALLFLYGYLPSAQACVSPNVCNPLAL